jgi:hypothetical protein
MLEEHEWSEVSPLLSRRIEMIKDFRRAHGASLDEALEEVRWDGALVRYREITGYTETDSQNIRHHRLRAFGPPCLTCGKPLRTSRAKLCAACGAPAESGKAPPEH